MMRGSRFGAGSGRRRLGLWPCDPGKHLVLGSEDLGARLIQDEDCVDGGECARSMRDHDDDAAAPAHAKYRLRQRRLAVGVEVRVGLVEHDEEGVAVECARERDPLLLTR